MLKELRDFCNKNNGQIYVYGAGLYGRRMGVWLDENGYAWKGFVETTRSLTSALNKSVFEFSKNFEREEGAFLICVSSKFLGEIVSVIRSSRIENYLALTQEQIEEIDSINSYSNEYPVSRFVNVLLYHRVIDLESDPQLLAVDVSRFDEHIRYLKDNYRILRFEDDWSDVSERSVVVTFDDGYADNYLHALPVLEKHKVPATIFVSTGNLDTNQEMWWDQLEALLLLNDNLPNNIEVLGEILDLSTNEETYQSYLKLHKMLKAIESDVRTVELKRLENVLKPHDFPRDKYRMMTSEELKKMSESEYITIGGHTVTHSCLAIQSLEKQRWEIETSKKQIETTIGKKLEVFSYPFGGVTDYTDETCGIVEKVGYKRAGIVKAGISGSDTDSYRIPRNLVRNWDIKEFRRMLNRTWSINDREI